MSFSPSHDECLGTQPPKCRLFNKLLGIRNIQAEHFNTKWTKLLQLQHRNRSVDSQQTSTYDPSRHVLWERLTIVIY